MSEFRTYRVRFTEWTALAINVSAKSPNEACELVRRVHNSIGPHPFQQFSRGTQDFEPEELDVREYMEGGAA
jgi:hypothetical protein